MSAPVAASGALSIRGAGKIYNPGAAAVADLPVADGAVADDAPATPDALPADQTKETPAAPPKAVDCKNPKNAKDPACKQK